MKKLLGMVLAVIMGLSCSATVLAKNDVSDQFVGKANEKVEAFIKTVKLEDVSEKDYDKAEKMVEKTNEKILKMVEKAMSAENLNIDKIVDRSNDRAFRIIENAAKMGIEVECEYTAYEIQGQIVYIDPLRVVRR